MSLRPAIDLRPAPGSHLAMPSGLKNEQQIARVNTEAEQGTPSSFTPRVDGQTGARPAVVWTATNGEPSRRAL